MSTQAIDADPRKFKIYRNRQGWPTWYQRWFEAWWILTGEWSLHRAWQDGLTHGQHCEWRRVIINLGDIDAQRANVKRADRNIAEAERKRDQKGEQSNGLKIK